MKQRIGMLAIVTLLAACSNSGNAPVSQPAQQGAFALQSQSVPGAGEQRVTLHALSTAGTIITVVGQLNYDTTRLTMKGCEVSSAGAAAGKQLNVAEPRPGLVRAVVVGGLQPLPDGSDVLTCTFAPAPGAPAGPVPVHAEGNVSDMSFVARPFVAEGTVDVGN
ncbi:MAG: hypothetical protein ACHQ9S_02865 [Candidatus Binatia bacterium]